MENIIKYFKITENDISTNVWIMQIIASRCYGEDVDPDTNKDWRGYNNIEISVIRTKKNYIPSSNKDYNIVSNCVYTFSSKELEKDYISKECNNKVEKILKTIEKLPIGKCPSSFYIMVNLKE